jgi:sigma-54 dependent transcriptional regulator, acetoin dehydrogenase operon transcriptional activator AcoR
LHPKPRVLFISERNARRGPMAEGLLRHITEDRVEACSAGIDARSIDDVAVRAMDDIGVDISDHGGLPLADLDTDTFDLVVTLDAPSSALRQSHLSADTHEDDPTRAMYAGVPGQLHWTLPDAADTDVDDATACEQVRDTLHHRIQALVHHGYLEAFATHRWQLDTVLDVLQDGIVIHDDGQRIQAFNKAAEQMTGYDREDVIGRHCHDVFGSGGVCGGQCDFIDGPTGTFCCHDREIPFVTKSGEDRLLNMVVTRGVRTEGGKALVVASIRNVTELSELRHQHRRVTSMHGMAAMSSTMHEIFETIRQVGRSDYPTLILGESGTGKELSANAIHNESRRKGGPFVPINCGALPENILESELFGHVRGAFTGAIRDKKGRFELAHGGTLFLDEVGELSPAFQVRLLRVLQEKRFEKVGGEKSVSVDVRIVSATNRDLKQMVADGEFREDLFYRLAVVPITLPPLRDRREDIPLIIEQVLEQVRQESGKDIRSVTDEAMQVLMSQRWPGNVRELINALQFASVRCDGAEIEPRHLAPDLLQLGDEPLQPLPVAQAVEAVDEAPTPRRRKLTVESVREALDQTGGNKVKAAKVLGVGRATLYRFLNDHPVS